LSPRRETGRGLLQSDGDAHFWAHHSPQAHCREASQSALPSEPFLQAIAGTRERAGTRRGLGHVRTRPLATIATRIGPGGIRFAPEMIV
jgi:hypothetical protein